MSFLKNIFTIARAKHRAQRYRVDHQTLSVMRFAGPRPSRMKSQNFELFHKRSLLKTAAFSLSLCALAFWTFNNYVELLKSIVS